MNVLAQEQALLELIASDRERRCAEILGNARAEAARLLRQAHAQARERVRTGLHEARERARHRVAASTARWQTRLRLAQQGNASDFLARATAMLPTALVARWQQRDARLRWVSQALQQARLALPAGDWRIEHAPGLQPEDIAMLQADGLLPSRSSFHSDLRLLAGVRILGNGNCVDASLSGLIADRDNLAASLLRAWENSR